MAGANSSRAGKLAGKIGHAFSNLVKIQRPFSAHILTNFEF
jgi:hypothetical protein